MTPWIQRAPTVRERLEGSAFTPQESRGLLDRIATRGAKRLEPQHLP